MPAKERLERLKKMREERKSGRNTATNSVPGDQQSFLQNDDIAHEHQTSGESTCMPTLAAVQTRGNDRLAASLSRELKGFQKNVAAPKYQKDPTPLVPSFSEANQKDLWASLARQEQFNFETKLLRERQAQEAKMAEQRRFLDQQMALREEKKAKELEAKLSERPVVDSVVSEWNAENERKRMMRSKHVATIGEDRAAQIEKRRQRKAAEQAQQQAADMAILQNIEVMNALAKQRQMEEHRRKIEMKEELIEANETLKRRQALAKDEERELEKRIVEAMQTREMGEHAKRDREAALFQEKVRVREAMAMQLQATMEQKSAEDEARALRIAEERNRKDLAAQREAQERREREKETVLKILKLQVDSRRLQREEEENSKRNEKAELTALYRREVAKVREEHERDRAKLAAQRELLNAQMQERSQLHPVLVSSEEMKLNASLLARAQRDADKHTPLPHTSPSRDSGYKNRESSSKIY